MKGAQRTAPIVKPLAVDAKQLGAMLGVSVRTIRSMHAAGKLPRPVTIGGRSIRWILDGSNGLRAWLVAGCPDRLAWEALPHDEKIQQ